MPLYEFRCEPCGLFEEWRSMADSGKPAFCPTCQTLGRRVFSAPAINLSGSLPLRREGKEPQRIQRQEQEPKPQKFQSQQCGRPWMLNH